MSLRTTVIRSSLCALKIQRTKACVNLEFVRFRKPRFEPKAPSKIYRVREPTPVDPVEYELMKNWTRLYQTQIKSLRSYLASYSEKVDKFAAFQTKTLTYQEQVDIMTDRNTAFNRQSSHLRQPALEELAKTKLLIKEKMLERDHREKEEMRKKAEENVEQEREKFPEYTLPTNLDDSIERLLNTRADHNYPITRRGQIVTNNTAEDDSKQENNSSEPLK